MGNCFSCFKVPPPPSLTNQSTILEHKEETMELKTLFPQDEIQTHPHTAIESHVNGNTKLSLNTMSTFNGVGSDNCGSISMVQNNLRASSRSFYSRLPPLGRSGTNSGLNPTTDCKQQKEPSESQINTLFDHYKDPDEDIILADGIERLCDDLELSPDEFKVLVLAWQLNAKQMCQFTREEFVEGLKAMGVDTIVGIQEQLPEIVEELKTNGESFKDLYRFTYRFGLDIGVGERILPSEMAIVLWRLVFTIREPPLLERWLKFVEFHNIKGIPKDTWNMFLNFVESIGDDLGIYDDAEAWPSVFDDFVEYENDQMNQNIIKDEFIKDAAAEND